MRGRTKRAFGTVGKFALGLCLGAALAFIGLPQDIALAMIAGAIAATLAISFFLEGTEALIGSEVRLATATVICSGAFGAVLALGGGQ